MRDVNQVQAAYAECLILLDHLYRIGGWRRLRQLLRECSRVKDADAVLKLVYRKNMAALIADAMR